jgi:DNA-binding NtrC family response regulator
MANILVVDDTRSTVKALEVLLGREGYTVYTALSGADALAILEQQQIDVLLCDLKMPQMDGLTVLRQVKATDGELAVLLMSGQGDITTAVAAMKEGACDYLVKPLNSDAVRKAVQNALAVRALHAENLRLKRQVRDPRTRAQVIGTSPAWHQVCQLVEQVAPSHATILLTGESGTGKEVIAGLLHRLSPWRERPFVVLNAAALPATLLEAELFGHEKGAFTGALQRKPGHFELADGGTLFLDEIGDMPVEVQAKLLRVLQDGTFKRLGGTQTIQVQVRVVAATNKDLTKEVQAERFRQDLYYRLNVITLHLPPLRHRRQDIPLLAAHFLRKYAQENHKVVTAVQPEALHHLHAYDWPGNVRELENVIERAVVFAQGPTITMAELQLEALPPMVPPSANDYFLLPVNATLAEIEREAIVQALQHSEGNRQAVARRLEIGPATLYRKFRAYQIH